VYVVNNSLSDKIVENMIEELSKSEGVKGLAIMNNELGEKTF
jgi:hypothetical protein